MSRPQQCPACLSYWIPDTADQLQEYLHRHELTPSEMIDELSEEALIQYLGEEIHDKWPRQLIEQHGLQHVRQTLSDLVSRHGHGMADGRIDEPPAFLRWRLSQQPGFRLNGRKSRFSSNGRFGNNDPQYPKKPGRYY